MHIHIHVHLESTCNAPTSKAEEERGGRRERWEEEGRE